MKYLGCHGLNKVTDEGVWAVAQGCLKLQTLDLGFATRITDASLHAIGGRLKSLRFLSLRSDARITDGGIKTLSDGCGMLEMLDCSLCSKLRDESVEVLESRENILLEVSFKGCVWISDLSKYSANIDLPRLQFNGDDGCEDGDGADDIKHAIQAEQAVAKTEGGGGGGGGGGDLSDGGGGGGAASDGGEGAAKGPRTPNRGHSKDLEGELRPATVTKVVRAGALVEGA